MNMITASSMIENHTFEEMRVGDSVHLIRKLKITDLQLYAAMSGDDSVAIDAVEASNSAPVFAGAAHGMWGGAIISTVIGTEFPGEGTLYKGQSLRFLHSLHVGDKLDIRVTVATKDESNHQVTLDCCCTDQNGNVVITGDALVVPPVVKVLRARRAE
jgi:acyl dehydratase